MARATSANLVLASWLRIRSAAIARIAIVTTVRASLELARRLAARAARRRRPPFWRSAGGAVAGLAGSASIPASLCSA